MNEFLTNLALAVLSAAVPPLTAYAISLIIKARDKAVAQTDSIKQQTYITEITDAVADAVAMTSQTYVDALKAAGAFDKDAQEEAARKALAACIAALSPAVKDFIESAYGDLVEYLSNKIEAQVLRQKNGEATLISLPVE